jgi:hypothetical protein
VITRKIGMDDFQEIVNAHLLFNAKSQGVYLLKSMAKKMVGSRGYYMIWSKWFKYER